VAASGVIPEPLATSNISSSDEVSSTGSVLAEKWKQENVKW
jgi:hypothetical protein